MELNIFILLNIYKKMHIFELFIYLFIYLLINLFIYLLIYLLFILKYEFYFLFIENKIMTFRLF